MATSELRTPETVASEWAQNCEVADFIILEVTRLRRDRCLTLSFHGRPLAGLSAIEVMKLHRSARRLDGSEWRLGDTLVAVRMLRELRVTNRRLDVGDLVAMWRSAGGLGLKEAAELWLRLNEADPVPAVPRDVVLYGFGRIGRLVARLLIERSARENTLRLRAIVVRRGSADDLRKRASLLRRDSIHGRFDGTITIDEERNLLIANGVMINVIYSDDPASVPYSSYGIDSAIIIDNTGRWRDEAGLRRHLEAPGAATVLLTAPGKGEIKNIVSGVNDRDIVAEDRILSAASCTTNAVAPILDVLNRAVGIVQGHVETIHSFTNDQNLTDNFHRAERRGRAAGLNMVITETGAAAAVAKAIPELRGRLSGSSIRVPTPDVSIAILNLRLKRAVSSEELNRILRQAALSAEHRDQIGYTDSPEVVSSDFIGSAHAGVVDGLATIAGDGTAVVYVWYDNEYGYSNQVLRVLTHVAAIQDAGDRRPVLEAAI